MRTKKFFIFTIASVVLTLGLWNISEARIYYNVTGGTGSSGSGGASTSTSNTFATSSSNTFNGPTTFNATTTYGDNVFAQFGTTSPFYIGSNASSLADMGVISAPPSNILAFVTAGNRLYDYVNAVIAAPAPILYFASDAQNRNEYATMGMQTTGSREFTFGTSGGDDIDGTARNAVGTRLGFSAGDGGTLGGNGGSVAFGAGSGVATSSNGGSIFFGIGAAGGGGSAGQFVVTQQGGADGFAWLSSTGLQVIGPSGGTFGLQENGTRGIISASTGLITAQGAWTFSGTSTLATTTQTGAFLSRNTAGLAMILTDASSITFGNGINNPDYSFVGNGTASFGGPIVGLDGATISQGLVVNAGAIINGGFTSTNTSTLATTTVNGAPVRGILSSTVTSLGGSLLAAGACSASTTAVTGATTDMAVDVSPAGGVDPTNGGVLGVTIWGRVSSANNVTAYVCSPIAGTPTIANYNIRVIY